MTSLSPVHNAPKYVGITYYLGLPSGVTCCYNILLRLVYLSSYFLFLDVHIILVINVSWIEKDIISIKLQQHVIPNGNVH